MRNRKLENLETNQKATAAKIVPWTEEWKMDGHEKVRYQSQN